MRCLLFALVFVALARDAECLKFLCYNPSLGGGHVNYQLKLSEELVDAGHEVVVLMPLLRDTKAKKGSKKARVIEVPQFHGGQEFEKLMDREDGFLRNVWKAQSAWDLLSMIFVIQEPIMKQCNVTLNQPGLMEQLRSEKFDAAFLEMTDFCGMAVIRTLGIEKFAIAMSMGSLDGAFYITGVPDFPAYVPSGMAGLPDSMTFLQRTGNLIGSRMMHIMFTVFNWNLEKFVADLHPDWGSLMDMYADASLVFLANEPLIEYQRPISHKIIDIGGITAHDHHSPLNKTWSEVLSLRPKTVLLSFGSVAKSFQMPDPYKKSILDAFRKFPDVTFIWKYEAPEDRISNGIDNIVESTWVPQNDLLHDPRLSLFITHCGAGSTMEATRAGKPLIVIPVMGDQQRNAQVIRRIGTGIVLDKTDLENSQLLEDTIREVLENDSYKKAAEYTADMLKNRPFKMKDVFVKNMEFMAKYGPLKMLDHYSRHLNFAQYYLIDVFAFLAAIVLLVLGVVIIVAKCTLKWICSLRGGRKSKND